MRYVLAPATQSFDHETNGEADDEADENLQHGSYTAGRPHEQTQLGHEGPSQPK